MTIRPTLRTVLLVDAAACLAMGAGLAALASPLGGLTELPSALLRGAGLLLLPVGLFILAVATRREPPRGGVGLVVLGNLAWVLASLVLPLGGLVEPNALGLALLLGQAAAVGVLTGLELGPATRDAPRPLQA